MTGRICAKDTAPIRQGGPQTLARAGSARLRPLRAHASRLTRCPVSASVAGLRQISSLPLTPANSRGVSGHVRDAGRLALDSVKRSHSPRQPPSPSRAIEDRMAMALS